MKIVKMDQAHIQQIAELERLCFCDPWSEQSIASELNNRLSLWLVAEEKGQVLGYVGSQSVLGESDMMNLAVAPDYRRRGIAKLLIERLIEELTQKNNTCLSLEVRKSNAPAIALYEQVGFVQVGERPNYYRHPKENALILRREWNL